jgi:maltose O-acetyltransferase
MKHLSAIGLTKPNNRASWQTQWEDAVGVRTWFSFFNGIQASPFVSTSVRMRLLKRLGIICEPGAVVYENTFFGSSKVKLGKNSFVSVRCLLDGSDWIVIGDDVHLAMGVSILTSTHEIGLSKRRAGTLKTAGVTVGNGCWLGANVTVQPGVNIAEGCIIAAGSVVTSSTEPNGLYAGIPAKRLKDL